VKKFLKWGLRLLLLAVVLVVVFFLSLDSILRVIIEHNLRGQSGMEAKIGKFHFGIMEPVVEIKDLQLYSTNRAQFGNTPILTIPEIHVEYDRDALRNSQIHITILRFNLGELDVVKGRDGETNILSLGLESATKAPPVGSAPTSNPGLAELQERGLEFKGIDNLSVSVGTFKYVDLQNQSNNLEQKIGIDNCVVTNVTSAADLSGLVLLLGLRSGDFFKPLVAPNDPGAGGSAQDVLKMLGH
jgi:hypothetical protein